MAIELRSKKLFLASPHSTALLFARVFYTRAMGLEKCSVHDWSTRSDTADGVVRRYSRDNGRTWSEPEPILHHWQTDAGTVRTGRYGGGPPVYVDPERDLLLRFYHHGVLPTDDPWEALTQWAVEYEVSTDGGRTPLFQEPVVQRGPEFSPEHPVEGMWTGRNGMFAVDMPIRSREGKILQSVNITPLSPDGKLHNPGGGADYGYQAVLIGTWGTDNHVEWDLSQFVIPDPNRTTRGFWEGSLAQVPDGRILLVMRGSNDARPELPGYKWFTVSSDGGYTWTDAKPWRYADGETLHSPSSMLHLLQHSNGNTYWIGNISPANPKGNSPRHPLLVGELDEDSLMLRRETLCVVDDRGPEDDERLQLSNFLGYEDRETAEIVINCSPFFGQGRWHGDSYEYRLVV